MCVAEEKSGGGFCRATWGRKHMQVCKPPPWEGEKAEEEGSVSEPHMFHSWDP